MDKTLNNIFDFKNIILKALAISGFVSIVFLIINYRIIFGLISGLFIGVLNFIFLVKIVQNLKPPLSTTDNKITKYFIKFSGLKLLFIGILCYISVVLLKLNIIGIFTGVFIALLTVSYDCYKRIN